MAYEFKLPDIGEGIHEGEIVQWLVASGDFVKEDQPIVEIMTDKVTAEIPSPVSGVISDLRGKAGEIVHVGSVIATFNTEQSGLASANASSQALSEKPATKTEKTSSAANGSACSVSAVGARESSQSVLAAPATRKLARELGVDLAAVSGSGPRGRVTQADVRGFQSVSVKQPSSAVQRGDGAAQQIWLAGGEQRIPFGGMRRKIAEHLVKSKQTAPHFAYVEEVDMTRLVAMREELLPAADEQGVKLSYLPFMIKAVVAGLRKYPVLNAQLDMDAQEIVYKNDVNMGIAVATDHGLVVPVVPFADRKNLFTLAQEIKTLAEKARQNKLTLDELRGGTFTLTSIGSIGGLFSVPILNYPEVAIMGVNKIEKRPVVRNIDGVDQIVIRDVMYLSVSGDHRVVDGAEMALFVKEVIRYLENPAWLMGV